MGSISIIQDKDKSEKLSYVPKSFTKESLLKLLNKKE